MPKRFVDPAVRTDTAPRKTDPIIPYLFDTI